MLYWYVKPTHGGVIQKVRKCTMPFSGEGWHQVTDADEIELVRSKPSSLRWDDTRGRLTERHPVTLCKSCDFFPADNETEAHFTVSGIPEGFEKVRVILNSRIFMLKRGEPLVVVADKVGLYQFALIDPAFYASPDAITIRADPLQETTP